MPVEGGQRLYRLGRRSVPADVAGVRDARLGSRLRVPSFSLDGHLTGSRPTSSIKSNLAASTSEVVRDALRQWKMRRAIQIQEIAAQKSDFDKGLADVAAGRVKDLDKKKIVERGRKLLASRSSSE